MLLTTDDQLMAPRSASSRRFFDQIEARMGPSDFQSAEAHVDALIFAQKQDEVHVASWLPGSDWNGTPLQPIYDACCNLYPAGDPHEMSARFFGQLVRSRFAAHSDTWYCTLNEYVAKSWIYFRKR